MRKFTTILCSIAFAVFGVGLAISGLDPPNLSHAQLANASTLPIVVPQNTAIVDYSALPLDLRLGQENKANDEAEITVEVKDSVVIDSLQKRIIQLESKPQVTKIKWRTGPAPPPIVQKDTIRVPVYYLATQVGIKEEPTGECISVYEVHKVDEICPELETSPVNDR